MLEIGKLYKTLTTDDIRNGARYFLESRALETGYVDLEDSIPLNSNFVVIEKIILKDRFVWKILIDKKIKYLVQWFSAVEELL